MSCDRNLVDFFRSVIDGKEKMSIQTRFLVTTTKGEFYLFIKYDFADEFDQDNIGLNKLALVPRDVTLSFNDNYLGVFRYNETHWLWEES